MKFIVIIPARYQSTRFPGKPLARIGNKPMIEWVYKKAKLAIDHVFVATDDDRIAQAVADFGGVAIKTSADHKSGTDRCAEAANIIAQKLDFDVVVNIQGDEPFIEPEQIKALVNSFDSKTQIATLVKKAKNIEEVKDANRPKVVVNAKNETLYFSRSVIPFIRDDVETQNIKNYLLHIGMYAYRKAVLQEITALSESTLEKSEQLEQLRWLQNGYKIKTALTTYSGFGIDTPEDMEKANKLGLVKINR